ncbi:MAG: DUF4249 family protein [Bacteroidota bacterium]
MRYINIIFALLVASFGCSETIDWEVESDEIRLVVEGRITNESKVHQIKLTETSDYFNATPAAAVIDATVSVFDGTETIAFMETDPGIYSSPVFAGEVGRTYELSISLATPLAQQTDFTARSTMLAPPILDSLSAENILEEEGEDDEPYIYTRLSFWGTGNELVDNGYLMEVFVNDQLETDTINEVIVFEDEFIDEEFEDFEFHGIDEPFALEDDSITLIMHTVESEFNDFHVQLLTETEPRDPFGLSSPPANVMTNVSGRALGYFYVSAVDTVHAFVIDDM